jgi:hypothetical protein
MRAVWIILIAGGCGAAAGAAATVAEFGLTRDVTKLTLRPSADDFDGMAAKLPAVTVVGGERFDFGMRGDGIEDTHTFVLRNDGAGTLELEPAGSSCQCTLGELSRREVPPGETAEVLVTYQIKSGASRYGQSVTIKTNDPAKPELQLQVSGDVRRRLWLSVDAVALGVFSAGQPRSAYFDVYSLLKSPIELKSLKFLEPETAGFYSYETQPLTAEQLAETEYANSGIRVKITAESGLPQGPVFQRIRAEVRAMEAADGVVVRDWLLPVTGVAGGDFRFVGSSEFFRAARNTISLGILNERFHTDKMLVSITGPHRSDVELSVAEVDPPFMEVTVGEKRSLGGGRVIHVPLTIDIPTDKQQVNRLGGEDAPLGVIRLKTTHPEVSQLVLYVSFATLGGDGDGGVGGDHPVGTEP